MGSKSEKPHPSAWRNGACQLNRTYQSLAVERGAPMLSCRRRSGSNFHYSLKAAFRFPRSFDPGLDSEVSLGIHCRQPTLPHPSDRSGQKKVGTQVSLRETHRLTRISGSSHRAHRERRASSHLATSVSWRSCTLEISRSPRSRSSSAADRAEP